MRRVGLVSYVVTSSTLTIAKLVDGINYFLVCMFIRVYTFKLVVYILKLSTRFCVFRFYTKKGEVKKDRPS